MIRFLQYLFLISILVFQSGYAQKAPQREWTIFQRGIEDYQAGLYQKAGDNFKLVIDKLQKSRLRTANQLMLAKSHYKLAEYSESLELCKTFVAQFPNSSYLDDIYYLMGNNYFRLQRIETAVSTWLYVADKSDDTHLAEKAQSIAEDAIRFRLDQKSLRRLHMELDNDFSKQVLLYYLAERYYELGNTAQAISTLDEVLLNRNVSREFTDKAQRLYDHLKDTKNSALRIAALLPLSGANGDIGKALLEGAQLAVDQFNRANGLNVELVSFDYETRLITALDRLQEIVDDRSISAIFGPVENDITAACAAIAEYENITLITPTSSEKDLRRLSSNLIQLATPVDVTANKLARYCNDSLQVQRLVTLAPIDDYFIQMTDAFTENQKEWEKDIISQQWYYPGDQDITEHFKVIKRIGLKLAFQDSMMLADSTGMLADQDIDVLYTEYLRQKRIELFETRTKIDSADIPVTTIDAIFMPVYKEDISLLSSQYAYSNIQAQILGNGDWYDVELLKKNKTYLNGLIFVSDGYLDPEGWDYRQFRNNFRNSFKRTPEKYELTGYDSFKFLLSALTENTEMVSRTNFAGIIKKASPFKGIYRHFDVGEKRYNSSARIIKYLYGQIIPLN